MNVVSPACVRLKLSVLFKPLPTIAPVIEPPFTSMVSGPATDWALIAMVPAAEMTPLFTIVAPLAKVTPPPIEMPV